MAAWMENNYRCIYLYFNRLSNEVKEDHHKDLTASEQIIFKEFLAKDLETRLCNKFVVDVTKPFNILLKKFEMEEPKIYEKWEDLLISCSCSSQSSSEMVVYKSPRTKC